MIDSLTGQGFNVRHACRTLGVSESGYYAWKDRPDPPRTLRRIWLAGRALHLADLGVDPLAGDLSSMLRGHAPRLS